jgi:superfamily I DNA/RNA helicase
MGCLHAERHCVVLAGPGSGKTKTLTVKMARMLAEDVEEPRGIACITYNNECARELERRLGALGVEPSRRVFIGTVHSFSLTQIVLPYARPAGFILPDNFRVANNQERRGALERAFDRVIKGPENPHTVWRLRLDRYRRTILDRTSQRWHKQLVWQIERKLAEDNARPIIFYSRDGTCRQPYVKGLTLMVNSIFNGWRMEDVWLDK